MSVIVLATAIVMGTLPVTDATSYSWTLHYRDGTNVELGTTTDPEVTFNARAGRCFTLEVCSQPSGQCTPGRYEVCADPIPGDTTPFDGVVGSPDYVNVIQNFGTSAP